MGSFIVRINLVWHHCCWFVLFSIHDYLSCYNIQCCSIDSGHARIQPWNHYKILNFESKTIVILIKTFHYYYSMFMLITHNGLNLMQKFLEGVSMCFLTRLKMAVLLAKFLWGKGGGVMGWDKVGVIQVNTQPSWRLISKEFIIWPKRELFSCRPTQKVPSGQDGSNWPTCVANQNTEYT